jgi:hypothetical protein
MVLVRPFTIFPPTACGNDILNAVIRAILLTTLIMCATYYFAPLYMMHVAALALIITVLPSVYKIVKGEAPPKEGFVDSQDFLQFYKPAPNPLLPSEEKGTVSRLPAATGEPWTLPTPSNPFMNILLTDLKEPDKWKPPVVTAFDPESKQQLDDFFRIQWFSDPTDVFGKNQGQRQFYTMPSNSIPNDRKSYQEWLYKIPGKVCKEGNGAACLPGTDGGVVPWLNKDA